VLSVRLATWQFICLWGAVLASGCGGEQGNAPDMPGAAELTLPAVVHMFESSGGPWVGNNGRWYSYQQSDTPCTSFTGFSDNPYSPASCFTWLTDGAGARGNWVSSQGPWWVDPNHAQVGKGDGFGFIHVLAFTQLPAAWQGPIVLDGTTVRFRTRISSNWQRPVAPSRAGARPARAYLWFQTYPRHVPDCLPDPTIGENCTRQSDFIFTDDWRPEAALDQTSDSAGQAFEIPIRAADAPRWTCLGAGRNVKYDCMPFEQAVEQVAVIGVILAPVNSCQFLAGVDQDAPCDRAALARESGFFNPGRFELRDFTISIDKPRATQARRLTLASRLESAPVPQATSSRHVNSVGLEEGSGVHLVVAPDLGAMRVGLTRSTDAAPAEVLGPQLLLAGQDRGSDSADPNLQFRLPKDSSGNERQIPLAYYKAGDRLGLESWRQWILYTKNDEVIHMIPSPCRGMELCRLNVYITKESEDGTPISVYMNAGAD
jgi:hypothetical protein